MGKGFKRAAQGSSTNQGPMKRSSAFITLGALTRPLNISPKGASGTDSVSQLPKEGRVWQRKHEKLDECVYHISLSEAQPMIVICDEDKVSELVSTFKNLFPPHESVNAVQITSVTLKHQRKHIQKSLRKNLQAQRGIIVAAKECVMLTKTCLPPGIWCRTFVHVGSTIPSAAEVLTRSELARSSVQNELKTNDNNDNSKKKELKRVTKVQNNKPNHIYLTESSSVSSLGSGLDSYDVKRRWMPCLQARCSAARKLANTMKDGSVIWSSGDRDARTMDKAVESVKVESEEGKALAGRVEGLKAKLKIAMSTPLPGEQPANFKLCESDNRSQTIALEVTPIGTEKCKAISQISSKSRRIRMELLGMVHTPSHEERKFQATTGRSLAATRWLDGKACASVVEEDGDSDAELVSSWNTVRYGASNDATSKTTRSIVEGFRDFVAHKCSRKLPKKEEEIDLVKNLPSKTSDLLTCARITALGWRPSPFGEGEWGGKYGKCCAHNEVALFYMRPFFPQEVLNTHVCSKVSPAPGNEGFDGCMEFLISQCIFYQKAMTIWDDRYFHYIDSTGIHNKIDKSDYVLRYHDENHLRKFMINLRKWTIETLGRYPMSVFISENENKINKDENQ